MNSAWTTDRLMRGNVFSSTFHFVEETMTEAKFYLANHCIRSALIREGVFNFV